MLRHCVSKDFAINNMKKNRIKREYKFFPVDFNPIDTNGILDIHKFLMKGKQCEIKQSEMYNSNYSY